jgi:hypothetical protein
MGTPGNVARPYPQRTAKTLFLRVPRVDWPRVKIGEKTEFRTRPREGSDLLSVNPPTPVVAYSVDGNGKYDRQLMVLLERRFEPLFAITEDPDAIAREGFDSYEEFRAYWRRRRHGAYAPMERVFVWRVRLWEDDDDRTFGARLFTRLYGEYRG